MATKKIKVEGDKSLIRDTTSNAILAVDPVSLGKHRAHRRAIRSKDDVIANLSSRVDSLSAIVSELIQKIDVNYKPK